MLFKLNVFRTGRVRGKKIREQPDNAQLPLDKRAREKFMRSLGVLKTGGDVGLPAADQAPGLDDETERIAEDDSRHSAEDDFRRKFLRKLSYSNVWVPQIRRSPNHQTVIIFDWDDTLLCTSWLRTYDGHPQAAAAGLHLRKIAQRSRYMLETASRLGRTYIVTNAMTGWVEYSAARWAPELLLPLQNVEVISARDRFEPCFPHDVGQWKIQAFLEVQQQLGVAPITNLVVLGDADFEMQAARIMGDEFEDGCVKTIKFQPNPLPAEHLRQVELVANHLERLVGSAQSMKVRLEKTKRLRQ